MGANKIEGYGMNLHEQKDQFDQWCDMWDKANEQGVFEKASQPTPPDQTADVSFFGPSDTHPTSSLRDVDIQYWKSVYSLSDSSGASDLLQEAKEVQNKDVSDAAKAMGHSPNPIRAPSVGMDQAMDNTSLGVTFTPEDIQSLAEMKVKLHGLKDKLNTAEGKGQTNKKLESQISSLQNQIDELSDTLGQAFPNVVLPQGD
jgi:hypothetical protein